jgi:hypothetical protein
MTLGLAPTPALSPRALRLQISLVSLEGLVCVNIHYEREVTVSVLTETPLRMNTSKKKNLKQMMYGGT